MAQIYRFFLRNSNLSELYGASQKKFELNPQIEPEIFHQLIKVLRVKIGDRIILVDSQADGEFFDNYFMVNAVFSKKLLLQFDKKMKNENELCFKLGLVLSLPNKPDKLTFILQKAVELGVKKITLVEADFSQFKHALIIDRLKKKVIDETIILIKKCLIKSPS